MANSHDLFTEIIGHHGSDCLICASPHGDALCLLKCCNVPICPSCYDKKVDIGHYHCFFCKKENRHIKKRVMEKKKREKQNIANIRVAIDKLFYQYVEADFIEHLPSKIEKLAKRYPLKTVCDIVDSYTCGKLDVYQWEVVLKMMIKNYGHFSSFIDSDSE